MFVPLWLGVPALALVLLLIAWLTLILRGRNPLPFPDVGSRIFTAATPAAKATIVDLLAQHGVRERFQANSSSVLRSIMWDGTIINYPDPAHDPYAASSASGGITTLAADGRRSRKTAVLMQHSLRFESGELQRRFLALLVEHGAPFTLAADGAAECTDEAWAQVNSIAHTIRSSCFPWYFSWFDSSDGAEWFRAGLSRGGLRFECERHEGNLVFLLPKADRDVHRELQEADA